MTYNYEIIRNGNASYIVKMNGKPVKHIFSSESEAIEYVEACKRLDKAASILG